MRAILGSLFAVAPFVLKADDNVTESNKGGFKIIQNHSNKDGWSETLHFNHSSQPDIFLDQISWPGEYNISPDDRWILRIQKTGSGDNTAYLYFIEKNGSLWRMEQRLPEMGFDYLRREPKGLPSGMYHAGIEFISWDMPNHLLHFSIHASSDAGTGVHTTLTYKLIENRIVAP